MTDSLMDNNAADPIVLTRLLNEQTDKRLEILKRINEAGSISEAARCSGVSYKAAWQAIETLGNIAGGSLVEKTVGGSRGGGTKLTQTGLKVLEIAEELAKARAQVLAKYLSSDASLKNIGSSTLRTSLRNHIPAVVETMKVGSALVQLYLRIDDDNLAKASITKESAILLNLHEGMEVLALTKAIGVSISAKAEEASGRGTNIIAGEVVRCERAMRGGECTIRLKSGISIVGFARRGHGLHLNQTAYAFIPSSSIVIALNS